MNKFQLLSKIGFTDEFLQILSKDQLSEIHHYQDYGHKLSDSSSVASTDFRVSNIRHSASTNFILNKSK